MKTNAIEDFLRGGQVLEQKLGGEIGFRQRVHKSGIARVLETVSGRNFNEHPRGSIGTSPDHAGIDGNVAALNPVRDQGPIVGATDEWAGNAADRRESCWRRSRRQKLPACHSRANAYRHLSLPLLRLS